MTPGQVGDQVAHWDSVRFIRTWSNCHHEWTADLSELCQQLGYLDACEPIVP